MKNSKIRVTTIGVAFLAIFAVAMVGSPNAGKGPVCDVKVNGSDGTIRIPLGTDNVTIDYDIVANDFAGVDCDAFLVMVRIENFVAVGYWSFLLTPPYLVSGIEPFFTGPLADMNGTYTLTIAPALKKVILAVDDLANGQLDIGNIVHWDHVMFRVLP